MNQHQAKDLFQLQSELIDMKVDMAVNKAIDRVLDGIADLKSDIHKLENRFSSMEYRMTSTKATLKSLNSVLREIRTKFIEYSFKAAWFIVGAVTLYAASQLHVFFK